VVLLDEIEKAHPDIFNILLQVLDEGELTDSSGVTVSFRDTVIIMTSNIGNNDLDRTGSMGFNKISGGNFNKDRTDSVLKKSFSPEFLNRVDEIVVFNKLEIEHLGDIIDIMLEEVCEQLERSGIELKVLKPVRKYIIDKGFDPKTGARNLRRVIQREIEDRVAERILKDKISDGASIKVALKKGEISLSLHKKDESDEITEENEDNLAVKAEKA